MLKRVGIVAALAVFAVMAGYGAVSAAKDGSWTGQINDSMCGAKNIDAACAKKCVEGHGAKYVFINDKDSKIYSVEPQDKVAAHAGERVTVKGSLDGDTIKVASVTTAETKK